MPNRFCVLVVFLELAIIAALIAGWLSDAAGASVNQIVTAGAGAFSGTLLLTVTIWAAMFKMEKTSRRVER
ncbi:hypothetical protein ACTOB_006866 [Actinoplanes oblitus]|uniref:Uncharacterized protein n=1 Tax=Actinoplanes oblitus TaxID=3040509 RepID=A0ABY8WD07_9ACTN|nr:hypothetical protein [Actinoplanes oblitus]WIM94812.1 hypothetical protein ACTOB_006866 [Actinoplanes oblitus]